MFFFLHQRSEISIRHPRHENKNCLWDASHCCERFQQKKLSITHFLPFFLHCAPMISPLNGKVSFLHFSLTFLQHEREKSIQIFYVLLASRGQDGIFSEGERKWGSRKLKNVKGQMRESFNAYEFMFNFMYKVMMKMKFLPPSIRH